MTNWKIIRNGFVAAGMLALLPGSVLAQSTQEGPAVTSAPRTAVEMIALAGAGSQVMSSDIIELQVYKTRAITVTGFSDVIVGQEAIANINIDSRHPDKVFIFGQKIGSTNIFFLDRKGDVVRQIEVHITLDSAGAKEVISRLLPDEAIEITTFRDTIFLSGRVRSAEAARQAVAIARRFVETDDNIRNMMTIVGSQQVVLQVRVSEMSRTIRKQLSANLNLNLNSIGGGFSLATTSPTPTTSKFISGSIDASTFEALESKNLAKTLAEPTLTAISGEDASFLSGGEIPYQSGTDSNGNAVYTYREYGIKLNFKPVVKNEGQISLDVAVEISALDWANKVGSLPAFTSKATDTTIDLPSGGSLMISGLLQDDDDNKVSGVPFLKDIPFFGALFRGTEFARTEKELVVTVTAYLASPTDTSAPLASPTDGFEPASDMDIYLLGKLQKTYSKSNEPIWTNPLVGPYGYIMK